MSIVLAHGLGGRSDLPIPVELAMYAAGAAVVVSFAALGALWMAPKLRGADGGRPLPAGLERALDASATKSVLRLIAGVGLVVTLMAALLGPASSGENPAPTWLYVWFWVGLVPASVLLGPVWRYLNPLRGVSAVLSRLAGDPDETGVRPLGFGYWPAAVGLLVFLWLELVYPSGDAPVTVFAFLVAYAAVQLCGSALYGGQWYAYGDPFEVYSTLLSRSAPFGRRSDGRMVVRNPLDGLAGLTADRSLVVVICVILGSTAFDGLSRTSLWSSWASSTSGLANIALGTAGLLGAIGFVAATYTIAVSLAGRITTRRPATGSATLPARFAHSLVPIGVGYTVAHYFSLLVFQGQAGYILGSDPLGSGANLLGTAEWTINYTAVSPTVIAAVQVAAIVLGHIVAVVVAHDRAITLFPGRDKTRSQYPLLAVMVLYTVGGIGLLLGA
jgi:hypothetical protein